MERRLAAILAADVVGYSRLMGEDETGGFGELGPIIELHISTFDDPETFVPEAHLHHDERIAWFDVADGLPRYHEWDEGAEPYRTGPATEGPSG